jgi:hypothetical protein
LPALRCPVLRRAFDRSPSIPKESRAQKSPEESDEVALKVHLQWIAYPARSTSRVAQYFYSFELHAKFPDRITKEIDA